MIHTGPGKRTKTSGTFPGVVQAQSYPEYEDGLMREYSMASERTTNVQRCQRCQGSLRAETAVDLQTGVVILQYVCFNCGRRWYPEKAPRPMTAA